MKSKFLLTVIYLFVVFCTKAQSTNNTYAITGRLNNSFFWADIKQVDITTGKVIKTLFEANKTNYTITNPDKSSLAIKENDNGPTGLGVAACALDSRHNRLYFATMNYADILFLDLNKTSANFTTVKKNVVLSVFNTNYQPEEHNITRMVIAADGLGYALTNDANQLIRFSTDKNPVVENLGNLIDAENNNQISIHNKCAGWGGDMVADAFGKLVIVSANHNIFTVDVNSRVATLTGNISGLPSGYTTNGAAVDNDGNLVVSSANVFEGLYKVNIKTFVATKIITTEAAFNASDLANGNFLSQKEANQLGKFNILKPNVLSTVASDSKIFPNPLSGNQFNVVFEGQAAGKYTVILSDITGKALQSKVVNIVKPSQVENISMTAKRAKGVYLINVLAAGKQFAFSEKLVVN